MSFAIVIKSVFGNEAETLKKGVSAFFCNFGDDEALQNRLDSFLCFFSQGEVKMISENELLTINSLILELYECDDFSQMAEKVFDTLAMLTPYVRAYLITYNEKNGGILKIDESFFRKFTSEEINDFEEDFPRILQKITWGREGEIITQKTSSLQETMIHLEFNGATGVIGVVREKDLKERRKRDTTIFEIIKKHMENIGLFTSKSSRCKENALESDFQNRVEKIARTFSLSHRETEILHLLAQGKSNNEIGEELCVSLSTVKKHIYNIFNKSGVNSRTQLLTAMYNS